MIIWLTGQPGSGKTTIANELIKIKGLTDSFLIDGDKIRDLFNNKDYSENGRRDNVDLAQSLAYYLNNNFKNVVVSMVSPYRDQREMFKEKIGDNIIELYIHTNEIRGKENFHTNDYQPPLNNYVDVDTTNKNITETIEYIKTKIPLN